MSCRQPWNLSTEEIIENLEAGLASFHKVLAGLERSADRQKL